MLDRLIHKWLHIPYALHAQVIKSELKPVATVLFIHGIGNSGQAWKGVISRLPKNIRVVTIDLLGFGQSPQPTWAVYSAKTQARSVLATYFKLRLTGQVIIVGHSLGALVAVEVAKRYPLLVRSLVLCSPPFYRLYDDEKRLLPRSDKVLKSIYLSAKNHPEQFLQASSLAIRYKLINSVFNVTSENVDSYMGALEAAIINQTSFEDVRKLELPICIVHGTLDPMVVARNIKDLEREKPHIIVKHVLASHEVAGQMVGATLRAIDWARTVR